MINFPIAITAIAIILIVMPKDITEKHSEAGFDWAGFIVLSICITALVFALMHGQTWGWTSAIIIGCFCISVVTFVLFVRVERRSAYPFVDLKLFNNSCFSRCVAIISGLQVVYISVVFWALFMQYSLLLSPQKTGVWLLALQVPVLFSSPLAGRMLDRYGPRVPVMLGTLLITIANLWIGIFCWRYDFIWLFPAALLLGIAAPMVNIAIMTTVISMAAPSARGISSGIISAARQVGSSVGLAILAAIIANASYYHLHQWAMQVGGILTGLNSADFNALLMGTALSKQLTLTAVQLQTAQEAARHAYTFGFSCAVFVVAGVALMAFVAALKLPKAPIKSQS